MSAADSLVFIDTNVLLYRYDTLDASKQRSAGLWLDVLWDRGVGRLSWQVLNEFYANATGKIGAPAAIIRPAVETYAEWKPAEFTIEQMQRAWHWRDQVGLSYWDGLILAAAEHLGCRWLLSEDFQHGRQYGSVQVVNPFRVDPSEFFGPRVH
jgi:predicted nucleic acid-binding protein